MAKIFLTGAVVNFDSSDPFKWHDRLEESDEYDHNFVNPYTLNSFDLGDKDIYDYPEEVVEPAEEAIEDSDGLLVRWQDDAFLVGSAMELKHAHDHDVPAVIWYEGYRDDLNVWLQHKSRGNFESLDKSIAVLERFAERSFDFSE